MHKNIPNILSVSRMVLAPATLLFLHQPVIFFILYIVTALTDTFDGLIARRYHLETELGALLDSIADHIFYVVIVVALFFLIRPEDLPVAVAVVAVIVVFRGANVILCRIKFHRIGFIHSIANKVTGFLLMASTPFFVFFGCMPVWAMVFFAVLSTLAALDETVILARSKEYEVNKRWGWGK